MKPATRGFLLGLLSGALLTVALEICGLIGLGIWMSSGWGRGWIADRVLRPPQFPDLVDVPRLGRVNYDWTLRPLEGPPVSFAEFRGQTVFLNVWATWCGPCVMEMPGIERLFRSLSGSDVAFVVVSWEDPEIVRSHAARNSLELPLYVVDDLPDPFGGETVPATFIIDPDGNLVFRHTGAAMWDDDTCRNFLRGLSGGRRSMTASPI